MSPLFLHAEQGEGGSDLPTRSTSAQSRSHFWSGRDRR